MPSPDVYADFVEFNVSIVAGSQVGASLSLCCLVSEFATNDAFTGRYKDYSGTANQIRQAILDDGFTLTSKPYVMADAFLKNVKPVSPLRIGRRAAADADLVASLTAIIAANSGAGNDFFGFCVDTRLKAEQLAAYNWAEARGDKFFLSYTRDVQALVGDANALPKLLQALQIRQGMLVWYDPILATKYGPAVVTSSAGTFDVTSGGTLTLAVGGGAEQTFTFNSAPATMTTTSDGPFVIQENDFFKLRINGGALLTVTFLGEYEATYFPDGFGTATAAQVAAYINDMVAGLVASATGNKLTLTTERRGTGAHLEVFETNDSLVDSVFDFPSPSTAQVTSGTVVPTNGDTVGLAVAGLSNLTVVSTASNTGTAILLRNAWNASAAHAAVALASVVGAVITLTFFDHTARTVTSVSPATADITGITNDEVAADGEVDGTGFAVDASAATAAEVATLLDLTLANADAATSGAKFTISSDAEGEADGSIEITGGTLVDEFGLEVGEVLGVGTQENYLDCQLLGRIAGFDLDAPNGSVGYDNQTVPQTPGNILTNTQRKAIWNANCNTYEAVTSARPGELHRGVCPAGFDADVVWGAFWFRVRGTENVKQMQNTLADRGERIPYTEAGIARYDQVLRALMLTGARNGIIQGPDLLQKDPLGVRVTYFTTPTIAQQKPSDAAQGIISGFDTLQLATGSAKAVKINLTIQTP